MNKKLTAKIQKLIPALEESEKCISTCLAIEPTERDLVLRKGNIYLVFNIDNGASLNTSLITKVVNDVLYDSYYHSDNISPIQSLEKAVLNINEKIGVLCSQALQEQKDSQKDKKLSFEMTASVLWGNVLYIVHYGKTKSFLVREGDIKEVNSTSEGNFSVASGVLKDDDVVVLCTENFSLKYPPEKLLESALSATELEKDESCMILKFTVDTEFTESEVLDFNLDKGNKTPKLSSFLNKVRRKEKKNEEKDQPIASLVDSVARPSTQVPLPKPEIKIRNRPSLKIRLNSKILLYAFFALLIVSVVATIYINNKKIRNERSSSGTLPGTTLTVPKEPEKNAPETSNSAQQTQDDEKQKLAQQTQDDEKNKVKRIGNAPFYDIKLADAGATPDRIALFTTSVVVTDPKSGKIFVSDLATPKFTAREQVFSGIKYSFNDGGKLGFVDGEGFKTYDLVNSKTDQAFKGSFGLATTYFDNIYSIEGQKLIKYVVSGSELTSSTWAENADFQNAKSIGIAYNIYILTANNELAVYTQGNKANFPLNGLDKSFSNAVDIAVDPDYDNIYVADAGNKRVVVLSNKGSLIKQYKAQKEDDWNDIKAISVNSNETKMMLLNGTKVYEINLSE